MVKRIWPLNDEKKGRNETLRHRSSHGILMRDGNAFNGSDSARIGCQCTFK